MLCRPSRKGAFGVQTARTRRDLKLKIAGMLTAPVSHYFIAVPNLRYENKGGCGDALMKSSVVKRSIIIDGHKTSVSLEDAFWSHLKDIAHAEQATLSKLVAKIDETRQHTNLSSAIRLFILEHFRAQGRK